MQLCWLLCRCVCMASKIHSRTQKSTLVTCALQFFPLHRFVRMIHPIHRLVSALPQSTGLRILLSQRPACQGPDVSAFQNSTMSASRCTYFGSSFSSVCPPPPRLLHSQHAHWQLPNHTEPFVGTGRPFAKNVHLSAGSQCSRIIPLQSEEPGHGQGGHLTAVTAGKGRPDRQLSCPEPAPVVLAQDVLDVINKSATHTIWVPSRSFVSRVLCI